MARISMVGAQPRRSSPWDRFVGRGLAPTYLAACVLVGGSGNQGAVANAVLQVVGFIIVVLLVRRGAWADLRSDGGAIAWIIAATMIALLLSAIPLPPVLWSALPGRGPVAAGYALLGQSLPWLPLSLVPNATIGTLLGFLPPLAVLLSVLSATSQGRITCVLTLAALAIASMVLGIFQQLGGYNSSLYIFAITSRGGAVGFFANRNHLATLLLMTLPFVAALAATADRSDSREGRLGRQVAIGAGVVTVAVGVIMAQSVAGWLLLVPALLGCVLIVRGNRRRSIGLVAQFAAVLLAAATVVALFAPVSPDWWGQQVGEAGPLERRQSMRLTFAAALDHLPIGTGAGSFTLVYPTYEPAEQATLTSVSHAHNDYLELLLETGLVGVALLAAFFAWWASRARSLWRRGGAGTALGRAGSVALALLFAHSAVDFPVRTAAIEAVVALALGLMIAPDAISAALPGRRRRDQTDSDNREISLGILTQPASPRANAGVR